MLRIAGGLACLLILCWLALAGIVLLKKPALLKKAATELTARTGGTISIGNMDISFFRHFPNISFYLSNVVLRDSGWQQHRHDLLHVEHVYLQMALFRSLFSGKAQLGKVYLEQGTIYQFTDSTGYSNTIKFRSQSGAGSDGGVRPPDIALTDIKWVIEKQEKHKLFDLEIHRLDCSFEKEDKALELKVSSRMQINNFSFNTEKGSYIKDKAVSGSFRLLYSPRSKILQADKVSLEIDGHPFLFSGRFFPDVKPDPFFLDIQTENIPYRKATALLPPLIQQKLDRFDIDGPISIHAVIDAGSADDPTPLITVRTSLRQGRVITPVGDFTEVSFNGSFTNEWVRGHKREDENSVLRFSGFSGKLQNIPLQCDSITIMDIKHPQLDCDLRSRFPLVRLNDLAGSRSLQFRKGVCDMNINYRGPMSENDSAAVSLYGSLSVDSGAVTYLPYGFQLADCNGKIRFKDQDVLFEKLEARTGSSKLSLKGVVRNIAPLLDRNADNVSIDWTLSSPRLDLEDLVNIIKKPAASTDGKGTKSIFGAPASRLDQLLREGLIQLKIDAAELRYKHFSATDARAELLFKGKEILFNNVDLQQGTGALHLSGSLNKGDGEGGNPLTVRAHLEEVNLPILFTDFSNFGQQAIQDKNLKGKLTADIDLSGRLTDKAGIVPNSLKGTIDFSIKDGQLLDFEPMEKVHEKILKNRDLSEIHFAELKNQLDLDTSTLTIHRMEIQSTAFTLFVEGTYDMRTGPDLSLQVPLSNLKDRNPDIPPSNKGNDGKTGLSVRLRARRDEDGKLKISWDPFKKALKKNK